MTSDDNYSINYTPPTASGGDNANNDNIIIPGSSGASVAPSTANNDEGIVITPDPAGIVIKTRLVKENQGHHFGNDNNESPYVPSSLASIASPDTTNSSTNDGNKSDDVKIFLNIVSHPIIDKPAQRSGLDDETGKEVSGWRLPTSMGELRPTFDKGGNAAFAADCILNPEVVRRMNADPNHFQFVCDLVIQCASRKFGATLDRRFKTPRMKYAGYIDELTSLPIVPEVDGGSAQKPTVAKQRVKGRKSAIVEEVESSPSMNESSKKSLALISEVSSQESTTQAEFHIELFIVGNGDDSKCMPLLDFLKLVSNQDDLVPVGQPSTALRGMIRSPKLRDNNKESALHESQLLVTPMPIDITTLLQSSSDLSWLEGGCSIIAKCSIQQSGSTTDIDATPPPPTVELSAFLLVVSTKDAKTECILPFPVDTRQASKTFNQDTGVVEVRVPLLQLNINDGPDIGTEQWKIQNAFGGGADNKKSGREKSSLQDVRGSYIDAKILNNDDDSDGFDESQPLAEDAFHAQDILSTHNLRLQEEEREARSNSSRQGVEYVG